jgi:hypothetical protein
MSSIRYVLLLLPLLFGLAHAQQVPATRGQILYRNDFEGSSALAGWAGTGTIESGLNEGKALAKKSQPANAAALFRAPCRLSHGAAAQSEGQRRSGLRM